MNGMDYYILTGKSLASVRMTTKTDIWVKALELLLEDYKKDYPTHTTSWLRELCYS